MGTLGRVGITVMSAVVLIVATALAVRWLDSSEGPAPPAAAAPPPVQIETPRAGEKAPPATPAPPKAVTPAPSPETPPAPPSPAPGAPGGLPPASPPGAPPSPPGAPPSPSPAAGAGAGAAAAREGLALVSARPVQAQRRLSEALKAGVGGAEGKAVRDTLNALADRLQFAPQRAADDPYAKTYAVASGDTMTSIGQRFLVPYELLMRINRMGSPAIVAGQTLKVLQGPVHVEISKSRHELQAWVGDACLRVYPVGIGAADSTPEGTFVVKNKLKDPPYQPQHKPRSEFRSPGAPDNPLGTRWIDIGNHYGIHGTIDPASIGQGVSEGCIRMHNRDVEGLYDLVVVGASKVIVRP